MSMSTDIRVHVDRRYGNLYNDFRRFAVDEMHELFFLCVCLGYRHNRPKTLKKSGEQKFWSVTIKPEEWCCYYAILLEENDMDLSVVRDDRKVISRVQDYANGGMDLLLEECLSDFLASDKDDLRIDVHAAKELPKALLHFIYEHLQDSEG